MDNIVICLEGKFLHLNIMDIIMVDLMNVHFQRLEKIQIEKEVCYKMSKHVVFCVFTILPWP